MTKLIVPTVVIAIAAGIWLSIPPPRTSHAYQASAAASEVIASEVFGRATPAPVENPELALGRVTIMPGAAIPIHYHAGTQIGVVVQGELSYTVFSGEVAWNRAGGPEAAVKTIGPGDTVIVRVGDALVEPLGSVHQGRNAGDEPLVIYLSTLFPAGAPRAILVDATPAP